MELRIPRRTRPPLPIVRALMFGFMWMVVLLAGCGKGPQQLARSITALTDRHEALFGRMLDCEERFCEQLKACSDLDSVNRARPQMQAEARKYRDLAKEFLAAEGLTVEKLHGIYERSRARREDIAARTKVQMERLIGDGRNNEVSLAIPHLEWFKYKIDFAYDAEQVASGRKPHLEAMKDAMNAPRPPPEQVAKERREAAKARIEESRARMESMRAKMGIPGRVPGPAIPAAHKRPPSNGDSSSAPTPERATTP